jgi:hypothetical protein
VSGRDPDAILDELGAALQGAWVADAQRRRRPDPLALASRRPRLPHLRLRGGRRGLVAAAAAALALVPTAIATRDAVWAPDPPPLPAQLRPHDAVVPGASGTPVYVGAGTQRGVAWRLSATTCRYGQVEAVGLFLTVPGGGAGARCDVATRSPGASPQALAARRVQTYYDPVSGVTWAFGALPPQAHTIAVTSRPYGGGVARTQRVAAEPVDVRAVEQGHLPAGLHVFVIALDGGRDVAQVRATDAGGAPILTCDGGRCDR